MHIHIYTSRVPGAQANGAPESEPDHPGFKTSTVPPRLTRRWLLRDQSRVGAKTFGAPDEAVEWLRTWIDDAPRRDGTYMPGETHETSLASMVEYARRTLAGGDDVVKGFYTPGGEYLSAYLISCPPRDGKWRCPKP